MIFDCPFCQAPLKRYDETIHICFMCVNEQCAFHEQTRYQYTLELETQRPLTETYMLDSGKEESQIYVEVDLENNSTVISYLEICILTDRQSIPRALPLNVKNWRETLDKIKLLLIFT